MGIILWLNFEILSKWPICKFKIILHETHVLFWLNLFVLLLDLSGSA